MRMKINSALSLSLIISLVIIALVSAGCRQNTGGVAANSTPSLYDRVTQSGKIRAAYVVAEPFVMKDPNSGKLSGIFVEALEQAGKNLGLQIEWAEEASWGTMIEGLQANRYDLVSSGIWANSSRAKQVDFTIPLVYSGIGVYVRPNDNRFTGNLNAINSETVKIATIDGEMSDIISKTDFPKTQKESLPQLSDVSQVLLSVSQGKADVTFMQPFNAEQFLKSNPGTLKNIAAERPIRVFGNTMIFKPGEVQFKTMLNTALEELLNSGEIDRLIDKYETVPGGFYRVGLPYRSLSANNQSSQGEAKRVGN